AACAALAIQEAMCGSAGSALEQLGVHPQVRIGLNSGVVVITAINNDLSLDYRAIGPTTHIASRMEQTASAGTIRLTRDTLRLTDGLVEAELLGQLAIKGVTDPVEVYELRRMSPGGTRFRTRVARGLSPMTGRAEEMELIAQMLREATAGQPHVIAIHGEPGVGKSRLCFEVTRSDPAGSFRVLECQASVQGPAAPYSAITALFRNYFGIVDTDSPAELTRRVLTNLTELGPALQAESAILLGLLDLASDQPEWQELDPASRKRRVFELARTFIRSICEMRPTLLILEDVHSLDAASLDFVDGLLQQPPAQALLVLLTSRTEMPNWTAPAIVRELSPLPAELADAMLRSLLGEAPGLAALRLRLVERTSGNPFFIEETLRSLLESGVLRGSSGHYELSKQHPVIDIPPTASALIASRIDALPPEVKALVQTAAVIGSEMAVDLLWRMSGLEENVLRERLASATESEVLYHIEVFPTSLCGFRHALTRDVAYESVLQSERRLLHARVVAVLEEVHRDRLTEHVERLAEHSYLGELWDKAVRYHIMAAARAASRFANQQAVDILDRGLRIVKRLPPDRARSEAEIDLRLAGLAALLPLGEKERISAMLFEAEATASEIGDQPRLAAIHSQIATALWILGQHEQARECAERALLIAARQGRFSLRLSARFGLIMAHHALGDLERCIDLTRDVLRELSGDREMSRFGWAGYPAILCRAFLASSLMLTGAFDDARVSLEQALQLAEDTGQPYSRV
ncbi:MAG TPA: AAA family ATPase, partial [Povalibacter sp.]|nr:AAA family ATPase [Povalibacter sp.]